VRAFIVTLGTIEWRINSVDFFHVFSNGPMMSIYSHTESN
jgi:hypothetical protein